MGAVVDATTDPWLDAGGIDALPLYFEERRRPAPVEPTTGETDDDLERRAAAWAWLAGSAAAAEWRPPSMIITRVIDLAPVAAFAALEAWWSSHPAPLVIAFGNDRLVLRGANATSGPLGGWRVRGALHFRRAWPSLRLEVDVAAWSASRTEVDLRPEDGVVGRRRRRQYLAVGPALIDRLAGEMLH